MRVARPMLIIVAAAFVFLVTTGFDTYHGSYHTVEKLNYDSLFAAAVSLEQSPEGQVLVQRCIERYGGMDKLADLQSVRLTYAMLPFGARDSILVEKFMGPNRHYKIVRHDPRGTEERILNENRAWFHGRDTTLFLYSGRYKAELFSYLTLSMPRAIRTEPFAAIRYGTRAGDSLRYLYLLKPDSLLMVLGIDPDDYTIVSSEGVIYQDTARFVFINKFSDFHTRDGYLFPYRLTNISMGLEVARSRLTDVVINPTFGEEEFRPPAPADSAPW